MSDDLGIKATITISERGESPLHHLISFDDEIKARKAWNKMIAYFEENGHIHLQDGDETILVDGERFANARLVVGSKKIRERKRER